MTFNYNHILTRKEVNKLNLEGFKRSKICNNGTSCLHTSAPIIFIARDERLAKRAATAELFFKKNGPFPGLFFYLFSSFQYSEQTNVQFKFCRWLESNRGPLVSKPTSLPTKPQPLPYFSLYFSLRRIPFQFRDPFWFVCSIYQLPKRKKYNRLTS